MVDDLKILAPKCSVKIEFSFTRLAFKHTHTFGVIKKGLSFDDWLAIISLLVVLNDRVIVKDHTPIHNRSSKYLKKSEKKFFD